MTDHRKLKSQETLGLDFISFMCALYFLCNCVFMQLILKSCPKGDTVLKKKQTLAFSSLIIYYFILLGLHSTKISNHLCASLTNTSMQDPKDWALSPITTDKKCH